jgi:dienelactone hydrolase
MTRRQALQFAALPLMAEEALTPLNRFPRMVHEYFVDRVRHTEQAGLRAKAAIRNKAQADAWLRATKEKARACFGPLPAKTPLNPRITGVVERDAYRIEKVIFESRPDFYVTANLYIPKGKLPAPAVVGTCGHSDNGKANTTYQSFAQGLARLGYVMLLFDPIGQGERLQYGNRKQTGVTEHLRAGNQQTLVGDVFATWRAWDGIRALDYLLTRKEVDPRHVGVTGNSGGGTMTTWLCALDDRWTMAAPSCFVTTFRRNLENELPADIEQYPPGALARGLDMDDFLTPMAPKPLLVLSQEKDFFDTRGAQESAARMKRLYRMLDAESRTDVFVGPTVHGYSKENREAMYRWFNRFTGISESSTEPALTLEKDETLWCTPNGQVTGRTVFSFTSEKSKALVRKPRDLAQEITNILKLPAREGVPDYRIMRPVSRRNYPKKWAANYVVETEPGIQAIVSMLTDNPQFSRPVAAGPKAVLYVSHHSADAELRDEPLVRELASTGSFFACDLRGIGDSMPGTCGGGFLTAYGSDYFYAGHSILYDYPYPGQRTFDLLRVLDWLRGAGFTEVHLAAKGWGAIPATFAAVLSPQVKQVTLKNALTSYAAVAESETYTWPLSSFVPGILAKFDLPDCYRALAAKNLRQIDPSGPVA